MSFFERKNLNIPIWNTQNKAGILLYGILKKNSDE
jgi:hypothetical protein